MSLADMDKTRQAFVCLTTSTETQFRGSFPVFTFSQKNCHFNVSNETLTTNTATEQLNMYGLENK